MLVVKTNPVGIDAKIQSLQTDLYNALLAKWALTTTPNLFECYGKCYRNKTADGYIGEHFIADGTDKYKEVYWNSKLAVISFFGLGSSMRIEADDQPDVHLIFFVDLKKLKPSIQHRADEEVRKDVISLLVNGAYGFTLKSMDLYLENVLKEYPGSRRDKRMDAVDMHPAHCFRLNFSLSYDIIQDCTPFSNT